MDFSAAIFDLDGTLIDSNSVWEKLDRIILERCGLTCGNEFISSLAAMTYEEAAAALHQKGLDISVSELTKELNELAEYEYSNNMSLKDGVKEYFDHLKEKNIKIALATASPRLLYEPALKHCGIYDFFSAFVTTDEVGRSKDFPDVYLKAAEKLGVPPDKCVVFEDVLKGISSASKAGMKAVGVYDKYSASDWENIKKIADKYIYSFKEML